MCVLIALNTLTISWSSKCKCTVWAQQQHNLEGGGWKKSPDLWLSTKRSPNCELCAQHTANTNITQETNSLSKCQWAVITLQLDYNMSLVHSLPCCLGALFIWKTCVLLFSLFVTHVDTHMKSNVMCPSVQLVNPVGILGFTPLRISVSSATSV